MAAEVFQAVLSAVDNISGPLGVIAAAFTKILGNASAAGKAVEGLKAPNWNDGTWEAPVVPLNHVAEAAGHARHAIEKMHEESTWAGIKEHVHEIREGFDKVRESIGSSLEKLGEFLPAVAGLAGISTFAGIAELMKSTAEKAALMGAESKALGMTVAQWQALQYAAKQTEAPLENLHSILQRFNRSIAMAGNPLPGEGKEYAAAFKRLGLDVHAADGHLKTLFEMLPELAEAFTKIKDPVEQAHMAMALFGRGGSDILPLLLGGKEKLEELFAAFQKFGFALGGEDMEKLDAFKEAFIKTGQAIDGLVTEIGTKLSPILTPLLEKFALFVANNRDTVAKTIATDLAQLADAMGKVDWGGWLRAMGKFAEESLKVFDALGGVKGVLIAISVIEVSALAAKMVEIGRAFRVLGVALSTFAATPAGAAIVGIGVAIMALWQVWEHWPAIKAGIADAVAWFGHLGPAIQVAVTVFAPMIGLPLEIIEHWQQITGFFEKLWSGVIGVFERAVDKIMALVDKVKGAWDWLTGASHATLHLSMNGPLTPEQQQLVRSGLTPEQAKQAAPGNVPFPALPSALPRLPAAPTNAIPSPFTQGSAAPVRAEVSGTLDVKVHVDAPPGTRVETRGTGIAAAPRAATGQAFPGLMPEPVF